MKSLRALKAAGLIITAVVLGLMTVQGSYALWNAVVPSNAGTIQSADFRMLVGTPTMPVVDMTTLQQQQPMILNIPDLKPGGSSYTTVTVTNSTNATTDMQVKPVVSSSPALDGFAGYATVQTTALQPGKSCETSAPITDLGAIAKGGTKTLCVKVSLAQTIPADLYGKQLKIPVTLTVNQQPKA